VPKSVLLAGVVLIIVGLGFKVAAVPFHAWTPDVYQGSPTPATGFMAAVAKAAGFAALIRILLSAFATLSLEWRPIIWVLAAVTLLVGSMLAIVQTDVKRMLAYSSISHAGYVLVGVQAASRDGAAGALFYLLAYTFLVIGSFGVVSVVSGRGEARNDLGGFRGLAWRKPGLTFAFTVLLLAQAGVPFTTGFLAKFYVVSAAVRQGQYVLAVIAMLAAAIAAFFYLRVAIVMYAPLPVAESGADGASGAVGASGADGAVEGVAGLGGLAVAAPPEIGTITIPVGVGVALGACLAFTIAMGLVPAPIIHFARQATLLF
jgi:NADH-quinone oxidoreductase subunit N